MPLNHDTPGYLPLLLRGLLAGIFAGLLAGGFAYLAGEPHIEAAIAIEEAATPTAETADEPLVDRTTQRAIGLPLATSLIGLTLGGILATAYTLLRRHLHTRNDTTATLSLAAAGYLGIVLIPFLKYPPNPPAVGDPDTINQRTTAYLATIALGLVAVWAATLATRTQTHPWRRAAAGTTALLTVVTIAYTLLPAFDEVPATFPATLLWDFRISSLGTQTILWTVLGITLAALQNRLATRTGTPQTATVTTT